MADLNKAGPTKEPFRVYVTAGLVRIDLEDPVSMGVFDRHPELLREMAYDRTEVVESNGKFTVQTIGRDPGFRDFALIRLPNGEYSNDFYDYCLRLEKKIGRYVRLGSWPRLRRLVEAAGYKVRVEDHRERPERFQAVEPDRLLLDEGGSNFAAAIRGVYRGVWAVAPRDRDRRVADVCRLFPEAPIRVVIQNRDAAKRLALWLEKELGEKIERVLRSGQCLHTWEREFPRITVCTPAGLSCHNPPDHHIVVLADGQNAADKYFDCLTYHNHSRIRCCALVPPNWKPGSLAQERDFESICGERLQRVEPPIAPSVIVVNSGGGRPPKWSDARGRRRALYTQHEARNQKIARVAEALYGGRLTEALTTESPASASKIESSLPDCSVAVVCEDPEQVAALSKLLRDWVIFAAVPGRTVKGLVSDRCICTALFAARFGISARVVVLATGGSAPPRIKWRRDRTRPSRPNGRFVVDFDDRFGPDAIDDTKNRMACYDSFGWSVTRLNPPDRPPPQ